MLRALVLFALAVPGAYALSPIHDASVEFIPSISEPFSKPSLLIGQYYTDDANQKIRVPGAYLHPVTREVQLGFALQTRWYEEPNNVRHLVFGAAYRPDTFSPWTFQADALWGVANYAGDGLTFTGRYLAQPSDILHVLGSARVGFLDALVWYPDVAVVSASVTPRLILGEKVSLGLEVFSAAQLPGVADFYSLDFGPDIVIRINQDLSIRGGAHLGVFGPEKSSPRFELAEQYAL